MDCAKEQIEEIESVNMNNVFFMIIIKLIFNRKVAEYTNKMA